MGAIFSLASGAINSVAIQSQTEGKVGDLQNKAQDELQVAIQKDRAAQQTIEKGNFESGVVRMKGSQLVAKQRVAVARSGADLQSGTPAEVMADTRLLSELDAQQVKNNAMREAWGHKEEATAARTRSRRYTGAAKRASDEGALAMVGNFIGTAGSTYSSAMSSSGGM